MKRLMKEQDQEEVTQHVDKTLTVGMKTVSGCDTVPKKIGDKVHFTTGKVISANSR